MVIRYSPAVSTILLSSGTNEALVSILCPAIAAKFRQRSLTFQAIIAWQGVLACCGNQVFFFLFFILFLSFSTHTDRTCKLWDTSTGQCMETLRGHSDEVLDVCFNTTGNRLLTCSADATARVYNVMTGACIAILIGHEGEISKVCFSPNGAKIITASADKTCRLWSVDTGECLQTLEGHTDEIFSCAFNYDGDIIITGSKDNTCRIWKANAANADMVDKYDSPTLDWTRISILEVDVDIFWREKEGLFFFKFSVVWVRFSNAWLNENIPTPFLRLCIDGAKICRKTMVLFLTFELRYWMGRFFGCC